MTGVLFQSTLPCGERPPVGERGEYPELFQSTLPCGERPSYSDALSRLPLPFQSTLPCGERQTYDVLITCYLA